MTPIGTVTEMKSPTLRKSRRALLQWGALLALFFIAPLRGTAGGGDTIGSLPSADGGDGTQTLFLTGPRALVSEAIVDAWGDGFYVTVDLPDGKIWIEFYGDVCLLFDEVVLEDNSELEIGLTAGFESSGMMIVPEVDGVLSGRRIFLEAGGSMETPIESIKPLAAGEFALLTAQIGGHTRARIDYDSYGGLLTVCQDKK